jgi:hypothetical protein
VGSVIAGVTVTTNNDKTGYALSQEFPTNFAALEITSKGAVTTANPGAAPTVEQIRVEMDANSNLKFLTAAPPTLAAIEGSTKLAMKADVDAVGTIASNAETGINTVSAWTGVQDTWDSATTATLATISSDVQTIKSVSADNKPTVDASGRLRLAPDGLDDITATEPSAKPTTFRGWIMWMVQRFRRAERTASTIVVKTEAGATVTTQVITASEDGKNETIGAPS